MSNLAEYTMRWRDASNELHVLDHPIVLHSGGCWSSFRAKGKASGLSVWLERSTASLGGVCIHCGYSHANPPPHAPGQPEQLTLQLTTMEVRHAEG